MILRKKGFTLIEMLVVIMIIAILAAALFPAISAAIAQAKSTAMKNKGRGIWTAVLSANSEREPLGMSDLWPINCPVYPFTTSTDYFKYLMGCGISGGTANSTLGNPLCEDLKASALAGSGVVAAGDPVSFVAGNNAWCFTAEVSSNQVAEDAFIFTRNIDFGASGKANNSLVANTDQSKLADPGSSTAPVGQFNLNRGIYVTYGGACVDRRAAYIGVGQDGSSSTNNLVTTTNSVQIFRP